MARQHEPAQPQEAGPLAGLHVLETGSGVAAPYAGKLLGMLGATVVKIEPDGGDPARRAPVDDEPLDGTSPLFLYLNAGKRNAAPADRTLAAAIDWADVVIESRVRRELAGTPLDPGRIARQSTPPLLAAATAWGFEAEDSGLIEDELLVQAASGFMTITGNPGEAPLRLPGWQSQYLAGAYTAAGVLAALEAEDRPRLLDVAWLTCMLTGIEGNFTRFLHLNVEPEPQGSHPAVQFPFGAFRCADGFVVPGSVRAHDWQMQAILYEMPELLEDERFASPAARGENKQLLWDLIQPWHDAHSQREIFGGALDLGLAMGMVMTAEGAIQDEHLQERGFLGQIAGHGRFFASPVRLYAGQPVRERAVQVAELGADTTWFEAELRVARP